MLLWFTIILVLIVQESFSTNLVLFQAYNAHYNIIVISLLFIAIIIIEIFIGYKVGELLQNKSKKNRLVVRLENYLKKFDGFIGKSGEVVFTIFLALVLPPICSSIICSYLSKMTLKKSYPILFLGDALW